MFLSMMELNIPSDYYFYNALVTLRTTDFIVGVGKTVFFGLIIAFTGCYYGLKTTGGTQGVGQSTTRAVSHRLDSDYDHRFYSDQDILAFRAGDVWLKPSFKLERRLETVRKKGRAPEYRSFHLQVARSSPSWGEAGSGKSVLLRLLDRARKSLTGVRSFFTGRISRA